MNVTLITTAREVLPIQSLAMTNTPVLLVVKLKLSAKMVIMLIQGPQPTAVSICAESAKQELTRFQTPRVVFPAPPVTFASVQPTQTRPIPDFTTMVLGAPRVNTAWRASLKRHLANQVPITQKLVLNPLPSASCALLGLQMPYGLKKAALLVVNSQPHKKEPPSALASEKIESTRLWTTHADAGLALTSRTRRAFLRVSLLTPQIVFL